MSMQWHSYIYYNTSVTKYYDIIQCQQVIITRNMQDDRGGAEEGDGQVEGAHHLPGHHPYPHYHHLHCCQSDHHHI